MYQTSYKLLFSSVFSLNPRCQLHITRTLFFKAAGNPVSAARDQAYKDITVLDTHTADGTRKTVSTPTTSIVDVTIYPSFFFPYIFQYSNSASRAEWFTRMMEKDTCQIGISTPSICFA